MEVRKIDPPYTETKYKELTLYPVFMIVGLAASKSEFDLHSLYRVILIDFQQWSSHYEHGPFGNGTGVCPLFFQSFTSFVGVHVSSLWSYWLIPLNASQISILIVDFMDD